MGEKDKTPYVFEIEIPYSRLDLLVTYLGIMANEEKLARLNDENKIHKIVEEIVNDLPKDETEWNRFLAERHGLSVETFLSCSAYSVIKKECTKTLFGGIIKRLAEAFDITERETWALWALVYGLI